MTADMLEGRVALVAGGTGPVGKAVAAMLADCGASVVVGYRSSTARAEAVVAGLPASAKAMALAADFGDSAAVDGLFRAVEERLGPVSVLVNAAHAHNPPTPFAAQTDELIAAQVDSLRAHAFLCRRALPGMRAAGYGRIVYIAGALMARVSPGFSLYGAVKAGATTLTKYIALENGDAGVTANVVAPGRVIDPEDDTPLTPEFEVLAARLRERMALDFPDTQDIAGVVRLLLRPEAAAITGQVMWATGGELVA